MCDSCKDGFFQLSGNSMLGCESCNCDLGMLKCDVLYFVLRSSMPPYPLMHRQPILRILDFFRVFVAEKKLPKIVLSPIRVLLFWVRKIAHALDG